MKEHLPTVALSIRQPWAWFIVHGFKDIENRSRPLPAKYDGARVLIHAGKWFKEGELLDILRMVKNSNVELEPQMAFSLKELREQTGGIVGVATLSRGSYSDSPWAQEYMHHWRVTDARTLPFMPCKGALGFFKVDYKCA